VLVNIFKDKRSPSSARVNASNVLLDYGHGESVSRTTSIRQ
jgi:hypothetical protein